MLVFLHTCVNLHGEKSFYFGVSVLSLGGLFMIHKDNLTFVVWHCLHLLQSAGYLKRAKTDKLHDIFNKVGYCNFVLWAVRNGKFNREWLYNFSCPKKMRKKSWCVCVCVCA